MARFRKKPVVIEAWFNADDGSPVPDWINEKCTRLSNGGFEIRTLEGVMIADRGDWIIRGVAGEVYPCKPDIFERIYEPA